MNKKIKKLWVKALRSGKYKQAKHQLYVRFDHGYCCLGVLCAMQGARVDRWSSENRRTTLVPERYAHGLTDGQTYRLASMNDEGMSFAEIADYIEQRL